MRLIVQGKDERKAGQPDPTLIALLTKAQRWFREVSTGTSPSVLSMAKGFGIESSDTTKTVYLVIGERARPPDARVRGHRRTVPLPAARRRRAHVGVADLPRAGAGAAFQRGSSCA